MSDKELNINIRTTADTSGADQTAEAINKTREAAQGAGESAEVLDQVTTALNNVKPAAEEPGAAMNEGIGPEQERALENARIKLDEYADTLTNAGSRMKAAFGENPGLTGFIDEVTNGVLTSEEFRKKLEQVDDVFEVLNDRASNLDLGAKWGDGLDENLQKIIDDAEKFRKFHRKRHEKALRRSIQWGAEYDVYLQKHLAAGLNLKIAKTLAKRDFIAAHPLTADGDDYPGHSNPALRRYHQAYLQSLPTTPVE